MSVSNVRDRESAGFIFCRSCGETHGPGTLDCCQKSPPVRASVTDGRRSYTLCLFMQIDMFTNASLNIVGNNVSGGTFKEWCLKDQWFVIIVIEHPNKMCNRARILLPGMATSTVRKRFRSRANDVIARPDDGHVGPTTGGLTSTVPSGVNMPSQRRSPDMLLT